MNRNEEYRALLAEPLPPGLEGTAGRALARYRARRRLRLWSVPAGSLAACFVGFMLLVNLFPPFARACGGVPLLRELAKAVAWSPSLSAAVEHDYVQPIGQSQTENGVTATVEYVIVDQRQLNIYYTLDTRSQGPLEADCTLELEERGGVSSSSGSFGTPNGELRSFRVDFIDRDMPDTLELRMQVYRGHSSEEPAAPEASVEDSLFLPPDPVPGYLADFRFRLEFSPYFTAQGERIPIGASVVLDGQTVTVTEAEVYPTHMRLNLAMDPANTAWLTGLDFYLETETGDTFVPSTNGLLSTGLAGGSSQGSLWLDSPYFSGGEHLTLHITGARWQDKENARVRLNLAEGTAENLPENVRFLGAERYPDGWLVSFALPREADGGMYNLFSGPFWDEAGEPHDIWQNSSTFGWVDPETGERRDEETWFTEEFPLAGLQGNTAYLEPHFNRETAFAAPVSVPVK